MADVPIPQRRDIWVNRDHDAIKCVIVGRADDSVTVRAYGQSTFLGDGLKTFGLATFMRNFRLLIRFTEED